MSDPLAILALALTAMLNPTLLAAVTVMMLLPNTRRLMIGYLLGAYLSSIGLGVAIAFSLNGSAGTEKAKQKLTPLEDVVLGLLALAVAYALAGARTEPMRERRRRRKEEKERSGKESLPERLLGRGSPRVAFALGVALTLPGASYLVALDRIAGLSGDAQKVAWVLAFCLVQLAFLEVPLLGYVFAPERTQARVEGFRAWMARSGRRTAAIGAGIIGALLIVRGLIELLA
jgi:Sap, sulfolipid-1-addressing protein